MSENERLTPIQEAERARGRRRLLGLFIILFLLGSFIYWSFIAQTPVDYASIGDHFKYGSIGSEPVTGVPYVIWKVLPDIFPDKLPGQGYASLGFVYEPGKDLPIGFSKRRVIIDRVGLNCAICHTGTVREAPSSEPKIYLGMPANTFDLQSYFRFLAECASDGRWTVANFLREIEKTERLNPITRFIYTQAVLQAREVLLEQKRLLSFMDSRPNWGPGRVDTFNPYKVLQFRFPMDQDQTIGTADLPAIWNQRPREGMQLHWDGNNDSVEERNKSAALGAGVTPTTIDLRRIKRIEDWLLDFKAPPYPFDINEQLAARGEALYNRECASCHDFGGELVGKVTPIQDIQTDPHRLDSFTYELVSNQNTLYAGYPYRFNRFRKTNGYANMPLDGIWLRGPYLHNGSVPTLRDLLEPVENRPKVFYRGCDVYDKKRVGFISNIAEENGKKYFKYDTALPGNGNGGHLYGISLTPEEKDAIVEYMKKL